MASNNSYLSGTNFSDGITAGVLGQLGNLTTGVPLGLALPYAIRPLASGNIVEDYFNDDFLTPKGGFVKFLENVVTPFQIVDKTIPLDVSRRLKIVGNERFNVIFSLLDFYGNKMTCFGVAQSSGGGYQFITHRCGTAIISVHIVGDAGLTGVTISTLDAVELPYANYNLSPILHLNYDGDPLLVSGTQSVAPYESTMAALIVNATITQTNNNGTPRPIIVLDPENFPDVDPFDGLRILYVSQSVQGFGFNIPPLPSITPPEGFPNTQDVFLNSGSVVFGVPSFNQNFKGWQG